METPCWKSNPLDTGHCGCNCSVLFFRRPRSEDWPHRGPTFSIYLCPLSYCLTLPRIVLSTFWCCPSRPCVVFLACVHLALYPALSLTLGNSLVSSWCDHSMLASLLWWCLTVPSLLRTHSFGCNRQGHIVSPPSGQYLMQSIALFVRYSWDWL